MIERLKLQKGEELKLESSRSKGTMGQTDINTYSIVNEKGEVVGKVVHTDHTALNGLKRTQTVVQEDSSGNTIVDERW